MRSSTENDEYIQRERVLQERSRRSSIALLLHGRARGEDEATFTPEYDDEQDPNAVDPLNLASALDEEDLIFYQQMVQIEPTQGVAAQAPSTPLGLLFSPRPAMATGGDEATKTLQSLMETSHPGPCR